MTIPYLKNLDVAHKTALVRTGFDVPLASGKVADDFRLKRALPTLDFLVKKKAKVLILTHLGRPKGWDERFGLRPVADRLSHLWQRKLVVIDSKAKRLPEYDIPHIYFFEHNILEHDIGPFVRAMRPGDTALLENLRFYEGEEKNDPVFAKQLAVLGDVYVNEAISNSHRDHASMVALPKLLPAAAGLDLVKDFETLSKISMHPKRPLVFLLGGAKVSDRLKAIEKLCKMADAVLFGGSLANLFLKVQGFEVGSGAVWQRQDEILAKSLLRDFRDKIKLPIDIVVSRPGYSYAECVSIDQVKPEHLAADIGPKTILDYSEYIKKAKTLVFNGPMGHFEVKAFSHGTMALARLVAGRSRALSTGIAGGGETLEVLRLAGVLGMFDHVSTGGSAMLMVLAGLPLPGLHALQNYEKI